MTTISPALTREEELHWLALKMISGLGIRRSLNLVTRFRSATSIFRASKSELEGCGLPASIAQSIVSGCSFEEAVEQQQKMIDSDATLITIQDPRYPARLREIFDPPVTLFARGRLELLESICIGVVGTRHPTPYGLAAAERLAADLGMAGLTIASGMARGIDTAAHRSVLHVNGSTIAILGCGADVVYPAENRKLAAEIVVKGLILSEYPMGAPPFPQNFPVRNRIISGISAGILVVEGAQYSGSSITARMAMDQGREVFSVPGNITSKMSWGPNLLIKQGAKLVQDWNDVVVELPPEDRRRLAVAMEASAVPGSSPSAPAEPIIPGPQAALEKQLMAVLKVDQPVHLDALIETLEYHSSSELIAALFELELMGKVKQVAGKNFLKVW